VRQCDAIVVGAGPGGATAALRLASAGVDVVVLEKQRLGRDKPCGGGLTVRAWAALDVPIDDLVVARAATGDIRFGRDLAVRVPLGRRPVWMVRRREFDHRLVLAAAAAGAEVRDREPGLGLATTPQHVTVETTRERYRAPVVLLATGAEGPLRAAAGLAPPTARMAAAVEVEAPGRARGLDPDAFVFDFATPSGYAWAFPKGDWWNVGVLSTSRRVTPQLRRRLAGFVAQLGIELDGAAIVARATGRRIPLHTRRAQVAAGRVALIGDAAGLADPLFGEGIAEAICSGRLAAQAARAALGGEPDALGRYGAMLERTTGTHLWRMRVLAQAVYARPALAVRCLRLPPGRAVARRLSTEPFGGRVGTVPGRGRLSSAHRRE
jgi:geranylgeranyl reductase family protein